MNIAIYYFAILLWCKQNLSFLTYLKGDKRGGAEIILLQLLYQESLVAYSPLTWHKGTNAKIHEQIDRENESFQIVFHVISFFL